MTLTSSLARAAISFALVVLGSSESGAQVTHARLSGLAVQAAAQHAEDESHPHHVAVLVGATTNLTADHTDPTVGIDYEYKPQAWHGKAGLAAFAEVTFAEHTERILGGGVVFHPTGGLKLFTGGGIVIAEHEDHVTHELTTEGRGLLRLGGGWDFHVGRFSLGPAVYLDIVKGHRALVYGVALGTGF
ncbi:MAG: hypothetical protein ABR606_21245 [Vicinamibacterales bacterium]